MLFADDERIDFDEFSRTCDLVEAYFGRSVDEVSIESPVSRRQLVAVLARAQLDGAMLLETGIEGCGEIVYESSDETVVWLDTDFWNDLREHHHLDVAETRAAREVHRQVVAAIDGELSSSSRDRDPFVRVNWDSPMF